ncbi:hypothetical protein Ddye_026492, partial [Dipteronia dyeriana]
RRHCNRLSSYAAVSRKMKFVKPLNLYEKVLNKSLKTKLPSKCGLLVAMNLGKDCVSLAYSRPDYTSAIYSR